MEFARINHELSVSYNGDIPEVMPENTVYKVLAELEHKGYLTGKVVVLYDYFTGISFTIDREFVEEVVGLD